MYRTKEIFNATEDIVASEQTDFFTMRNGRTYSITFKYNFGKMQEEKRRGRKGMDMENAGSMDMGY